MGFSFRTIGCVERAEGRRDETRTIKINWSPRRAAKAKEKPALKPATSMVQNTRARSDCPALRRDIVRIVRGLDHR
jgi:hypothetical protein